MEFVELLNTYKDSPEVVEEFYASDIDTEFLKNLKSYQGDHETVNRLLADLLVRLSHWQNYPSSPLEGAGPLHSKTGSRRGFSTFFRDKNRHLQDGIESYLRTVADFDIPGNDGDSRLEHLFEALLKAVVAKSDWGFGVVRSAFEATEAELKTLLTPAETINLVVEAGRIVADSPYREILFYGKKGRSGSKTFYKHVLNELNWTDEQRMTLVATNHSSIRVPFLYALGELNGDQFGEDETNSETASFELTDQALSELNDRTDIGQKHIAVAREGLGESYDLVKKAYESGDSGLLKQWFEADGTFRHWEFKKAVCHPGEDHELLDYTYEHFEPSDSTLKTARDRLLELMAEEGLTDERKTTLRKLHDWGAPVEGALGQFIDTALTEVHAPVSKYKPVIEWLENEGLDELDPSRERYREIIGEMPQWPSDREREFLRPLLDRGVRPTRQQAKRLEQQNKDRFDIVAEWMKGRAVKSVTAS